MNQERRDQIVRMVNENRVIKNQELMEKFDISIETVRRDLKYLEKQGYLQCVYGGAVLKQSPTGRVELSDPEIKNYEEKDAIAQEAAKLVKSGDTIFLEDGTTVMAMPRHLREIGPFTAITNSLRVAIELSKIEDCTVILPGGRLYSQRLELIPLQPEDNLNLFNIDWAFGVAGITETHFTDYALGERGYIRHTVIQDSSQTVVLADHSKFGFRATLNMAAINELDVVITDSKTSENYLKQMRNSGIRVIVAKGQSAGDVDE